jgi:formylglycine-generating enzyme required for sulfatase activity
VIIPVAPEQGKYQSIKAKKEIDDEDDDLALLSTDQDLPVEPAVLVGNLRKTDVDELLELHQEELVSWCCYGFPETVVSNGAVLQGNYSNYKEIDIPPDDRSLKPSPEGINRFVPTQKSRYNPVHYTTLRLELTDLPKGESGGAMLTQHQGKWYSLGTNRLGSAGVHTSSIRLYEKSQKVFDPSKMHGLQIWENRSFLQALELDLDSVLNRRSARCVERWDRTWTSLGNVENTDDESRWLAFYVPPHFSRFVGTKQEFDTDSAGRGRAAESSDLVKHRDTDRESADSRSAWDSIERNAFSPKDKADGVSKDAWQLVTGRHEDERLTDLLRNRLLVVFEGPGAGKTIFTKRMEAFFSSDAGRQLANDKAWLVIRQANWEGKSWSPEIARDLISDVKNSRKYAKRLTEQAMAEGRVVWILDGLDQVPDEGREKLLQEIQDFLLDERRGRKVRVVMTSRPGAVKDQLGKFLRPAQQDADGLDWDYARIEPFGVAEQYRYLYGPEPPNAQADLRKKKTKEIASEDAWSRRKLAWEIVDRHRIVPKADSSSEDAYVKSIASRVPNYREVRIQQLMSNPAILAIVRTLSQRGELPSFHRRADFYRELSLTMISKAKDKLPSDLKIEVDRVEEILAALAFASMSHEATTHEFRSDSVTRIRKQASARVSGGITANEWEVIDLMPNMTSRSFLLGSRERELRWSHLGVMEFYCGMFLANNDDPNWVANPGGADAPICGVPEMRKHASDPAWQEAFRFAIELGLSMNPSVRNEDVLLATLGTLFELPDRSVKRQRPTRLMFEAWSLLEALPKCDWYDAVEPVPLARGGELVKRYRGQFEAICQDSSKPEHAIARQMLKNFCLCPPTGDADPKQLEFKCGDDLRDARIDKAFELGKYAVTNAEYKLFDPAHQSVRMFATSVPVDDDLSLHPVVKVDWYCAWCYCRWLGTGFRLLTDKEWEYACRAGTETTYHFADGLNEGNANFNGKIGHTTRVGSYPGNAYGLRDMHGNVWEWCSNWFAEDMDQSERPEYRDSSAYPARVLRGGSWGNGPLDCRSAYRGLNHPAARGDHVGFRVARATSRKP